MRFSLASLLCLSVLASFGRVQADSTVFSQFIGATTATYPSSGFSSAYFSICTNYLHGLQALTDLPTSASIQIEQEQVDGVCQFCTGFSQSRIDSCCVQATSSACFDQFAAGAEQTAPASNSATPTATAIGSDATASSSPNAAGLAQNKDLLASGFVAAMIGLVGWVL